MIEIINRLFGICRSISGDGLRESLKIINKEIEDLDIIETQSGTKVFDWVVPKEWNIKDAWIKDSAGNKIIDFNTSNLHVLNYSSPVNRYISFEDLKKNLHYIKDIPDAIPYRTSYYEENWGFCLSYNQFKNLKNETYQVFIDSSFNKSGSITHGEIFIPGDVKEEVLISTYICHPSMCNDNLSGVSVALEIAKYLKSKRNRYSYRILFLPETIGAISWLFHNKESTRKIVAGFVLSCVGDRASLSFKRSRLGNSLVDRACEYVSKNRKINIIDYFPLGSDERQYCSPGFNLPIGTVMRSLPGTFKEYHTSLDNLDFIDEEALQDTKNTCIDIIDTIDKNIKILNTIMFCEPQLGKRGMYRSFGGQKFNSLDHKAVKWILNYSDGMLDLIDISNISNIDIEILNKVSLTLIDKKIAKLIN